MFLFRLLILGGGVGESGYVAAVKRIICLSAAVPGPARIDAADGKQAGIDAADGKRAVLPAADAEC